MNCYYYIQTGTNPYENLALEELLFERLAPDTVILYLWQNERTVVIGRNQNAWRECRPERLAADGGHLARRLSGGGAVYQDLGNQNFTFLASVKDYDVAKQSLVICRAAQSFGIDAEISGRNDILAGGAKFSGNAYHRTKDKGLHHGTVLIDTDLGKLAQYLAPSPEKLASKGVGSVRERVVNLCELAPAITPAAMREALLASFAAVYGVQPAPLLPENLPGVETLPARTAFYESDDWRLSSQTALSAFDWQLRRRFSFGELELLLNVKRGTVQVARVYSDAMDADWIAALERAFAGVPFRGETLCAAVPESLMFPACRAELQQYFQTEFR